MRVVFLQFKSSDTR